MKCAAVAILLACGGVANAETILSFDFNRDGMWPAAATDVSPNTPLPVEPAIEWKAVGTVDVAGTADATGAMLMTTVVGAANEKWEATFSSGPLAVENKETQLGKLTLAFDLSASSARPVTVRVVSLNAKKQPTGSLEATVLPAAPGFYQRHAIDLSSMQPVASGKFDPADPFIQIVIAISGPTWSPDTTHELRLDNLHYASPAFYVSPNGNDKNDGRSEDRPLADPQKAADRAKPGDIIVLMEGEYRRGPDNTVQDGVVALRRTGTPAAWITLKNYPGHKPVLRSDAWNTIQVRNSERDSVPSDPVLAYLEVRGLHIMGFANESKLSHADEIGQAKPSTNGNGISISNDGKGGVPPHHIRIADNLVELCAGGGIGAGNADWVTIENNVSRNNCWLTIYATSGISLLGWSNFDTQENVYKWLVRNNVTSGNRTYMPWKQIGKVSDGNGIIIDTNHVPAEGKAFLGRTLIQNNLSFNNGGSGIHVFKGHRIDIANNTAYLNGASPELRWGQIFLQRTNDARVINNVLWARDGQPVNTVSKDISDKGNTNIVRANNVYTGGGFPPIMGENDVVADPKFVLPGEHGDVDFKLQPTSPAIGHGRWEAFVPPFDIEGRPRPLDGKPDAGAYQR